MKPFLHSILNVCVCAKKKEIQTKKQKQYDADSISMK